MEHFTTYLGTIEQLTQSSPVDDKKTYVHPALKNLGCVSLVLLREAIAPVIFRNAEAEITDIEIDDEVRTYAPYPINSNTPSAAEACRSCAP